MRRNGNVSKVPPPGFSLQTERERGNRCTRARRARAAERKGRGCEGEEGAAVCGCDFCRNAIPNYGIKPYGNTFADSLMSTVSRREGRCSHERTSFWGGGVWKPFENHTRGKRCVYGQPPPPPPPPGPNLAAENRLSCPALLLLSLQEIRTLSRAVAFVSRRDPLGTNRFF